MQVREGAFLDLLGADGVQFVIPVYQRRYAWTERQCQTLWGDIMRAQRMSRRHFLSTLLYIPQEKNSDELVINSIVDGQQRCTTVTLVIAALVDFLREAEMTLQDIDIEAIAQKFLCSKMGDRQKPKLLLSHNDRATFEAILFGNPEVENATENLMRNYAFFRAKMRETGFDPNELWHGLQLLTVIYAELSDNDAPQLVFESLNSKGMPLTTADLIRNFLLIALTHEEQTRLYDEYWAPIEGMFQPDPGSLKLNNAVHGWLQVRYTKVRALKANEVYGVFKSYVEDEFDGTPEDLLEELRGFCLVWAENYKYHAVKAFRSKYNWAKSGKAKTLVSHYELKGGASLADSAKRDIDVNL